MIDIEKFFEFVQGTNIQTVVCVIVGVWYIVRGMRAEIKEEIAQIREEIKENRCRSDRLYEMFIDLLKDRKAR